MIVILDYDMGNVCSIQNMFKKIGEKAVISRDTDIIRSADKLILPGVGSFDAGMEQLESLGLDTLIKEHAKTKPLLGICLGMQLLGRRSDEGVRPGLGLIPFESVRFSFHGENAGLRIPHMGWDYVDNACEDLLTADALAKQRYYFVHSYYAKCDSADNVLITCDYGGSFAAAVKKEKVYGVQFHPEKSHKYGMQLLKNFAQKV